MTWFDFLKSDRVVPSDVPAPDQPRDLVLYKYDFCGYCVRVMNAIDRLGVSVTYRDTREEPKNREDLRQKTGRTQVPCLFVDGEALFESADIIRWLEAYAKAVPPTR